MVDIPNLADIDNQFKDPTRNYISFVYLNCNLGLYDSMGVVSIAYHGRYRVMKVFMFELVGSVSI